MESLVKFVQDKFVAKKEIPNFKSGDTITVIMKLEKEIKSELNFSKELLYKLKDLV